MVVCKCRKATRLYCFVHKVPVCGECICFPEHQICVVKKYSDWVVDGEYDWPTTCSKCRAAFEAGTESQTTRLGCLHLMHTECLVSHIRDFPPQTAPAGYVCQECSSPIWPPKSIKDTGSRLHSKLKEAIIMSGLEKNVFGNHYVPLPTTDSQVAPPAFASDPLVRLTSNEDGLKDLSTSIKEDPTLLSASVRNSEAVPLYSPQLTISEIVEIDVPSTTRNQFISDQDPGFMKSTSPKGPGATTRKGAYAVDRQTSEVSYYADDEDGNRKKYSKRGPLQHKFLRLLLPFWSNKLPTLPVTARPRKDGAATDDVAEGRQRHHRSSRTDPRKLLLVMAIIACMATMGILYYRLAQRSLGENMPKDEPR